MTRAPSSSPSWYPVHDDRQTPEPQHSLRRLGGEELVDRVTAKTIPRELIATVTHASPNTGKSNLVRIDDDHSSPSNLVQRGTIVQLRALTDTDRRIMAVLDKAVGLVSASEIAKEANLIVGTTRSRLDRLVADGRVGNVPGRGYRRVR